MDNHVHDILPSNDIHRYNAMYTTSLSSYILHQNDDLYNSNGNGDGNGKDSDKEPVDIGVGDVILSSSVSTH